MKWVLLFFISFNASAELFSKEDADKYIEGMEYADKTKLMNLCFWEADMAESLQAGKKENPHITDKETHRTYIKYILGKEGHSPEFINKVLGIFEMVWPISVHKTEQEVFLKIYEECRVLLAAYHKEGFAFNELKLETAKEDGPFY